MTSPPMIGSKRKLSLKFCMNQAHRTTVTSAPDSCTARSARSDSSSPRPDSSTSRRTPCSSARSANTPTASEAPRIARSGKYETYAARVPCRAGVQVAWSSQSNGGSAEREPIRVGMPRAVSRSTTRWPVLPVPPSTRIGLVSCVLSVIVAPLVCVGRGPVDSARLRASTNPSQPTNRSSAPCGLRSRPVTGCRLRCTSSCTLNAPSSSSSSSIR